MPVPITHKKKIISCICHLAFNEGKTRKHQEGPVLSSQSPLAPPTPPLHRDSTCPPGWVVPHPELRFLCVGGRMSALHLLRAAAFRVKHVSHGRGQSGPACRTTAPTHTCQAGPPHTWWLQRWPGAWRGRLRGGAPWVPAWPGAASQLTGTRPAPGDGQVDFEEFVTLLGPKLSTSGIPEKFHGTDFDTVFWKVRPG